MLSSIKTFFETQLALGDDNNGEDPHQDHEHSLRLATAALLIELSQADDSVDPRETEKKLAILRDQFALGQEELDELVKLAHDEAREAISLYQFTSLFNERYTYEEKVELVRQLWQVAYADSELDAYEEHLIRQVAELLYVRHNDFIRSKLSVRDESQAK